jgi:putative oxidoreductase
MKPYALIRSVLLGNRSWEQFSILLARVSLGMFFAISGGNKLFVASHTRRMYETLASAGIPFPHFMTYFVSSVEFISGCLLVIGLLSSLCCAALIIQMIVAITTVQLATISKGLCARARVSRRTNWRARGGKMIQQDIEGRSCAATSLLRRSPIQ